MTTKEFQIEENYSHGCKGFLYIVVEENSSYDTIKKKAVDAVREEWNGMKKMGGWFAHNTPEKCKPTITIREYEKPNVVKGGIVLKTKWRIPNE